MCDCNCHRDEQAPVDMGSYYLIITVCSKCGKEISRRTEPKK